MDRSDAEILVILFALAVIGLVTLLAGCRQTRPDSVTVEAGAQVWDGDTIPYASGSATWYFDNDEDE